ncbi:6-pyruvoyl trahydropterin synthase family protein [Streptomyces rimosus]|uniref:6-pyruvoyl trahydropterin synthase family protein n=1 Tax=Streptomyces rimosus TaxID=1927 RepID=UPI0009987FA0|nr:6-carboxytetrahydropterin synthase [Streptomyces rimosus]
MSSIVVINPVKSGVKYKKAVRARGRRLISVYAFNEELLEKRWPDHADGDEFKHWLDATFDHRHLNDAVPRMNPSAENPAWWMYRQWIGRLPELSCVRVSETPRTWATYRGK